MRKLYAVKITKKKLAFLLTAFDIVEDKHERARLMARILSRLSAMGFWGYKKDNRQPKVK